MTCKASLSLFFVTLLMISTGIASSQIDPGEMPIKIFEILDLQGLRLGTILVTGETGQGYEAGNEYWRFSQEALLEIANQEGLELAVWVEGEWDDPWVIEALDWQPEDASVEWSHPTEVDWTPQDESPPPITPDGTYFGNSTLGGLTIQHSSRGPSSMTWFKFTEGAFVLLDDGAVFHRDSETPTTGSWWSGAIDPGF